MTLAIADPTQRKNQRQHTIELLDQLSTLAASVKDIRVRKRLLREQKSALCEQLHVSSEHQQALWTEESMLLREEMGLLAQLTCQRERTSQVPC